jgi:hypothetical protein
MKIDSLLPLILGLLCADAARIISMATGNRAEAQMYLELQKVLTSLAFHCITLSFYLWRSS